LLMFFILLSGLALPLLSCTVSASMDQSPDDRYRVASPDDIYTMVSVLGVRDPNADYNVLVDGMGTGLAPPSAGEWELMLGEAVLDTGTSEYEVPASPSLDLSSEPYFPQVRNQGSEGSCAAFALTYYNYGYIEARDQGWTLAKSGNDSQLLSPSWTYNKVNGADHEGSGYFENARIIQQLGAATWSSYPYLDSDDQGYGGENAWRSAPSHRISSYVYLWNPDPESVVDIIKEQLGMNRPVSFAIDAYEYYPAFADGNKIMSAAEYDSVSYNHGQTIVGYDDALTDDGEVGAFKVVNSWGASWGSSGFYWITYDGILEMLGYPMIYLVDREDHQPTLLATWEFSTAPSVDADIEVGMGSYAAPVSKMSTYFSSGSSDRMPSFMAMDASSLFDDYSSGENNFYLTLKTSALTGTVSSFSVEIYDQGYSPGVPSAIVADSTEVPKAVPGTVNAMVGVQGEDTIKPVSEVQDLPAYVNASSFTVQITSSDAGCGVDHVELYYQHDGGSYLKYVTSSNPSGEWTGSVTFDISQAAGQGIYHFYSIAEDGAGNRESAPTAPDATVTVDLLSPSTNAMPSGTAGTDGWYVSQVTVTMNAVDAVSGVQSTAYRLNGGIWNTYASPLSLSQGKHLLEYRSVDKAGNWEMVKVLEIDVDTNPPTVDAQTDLTPVNDWYRSPVEVVLTASDVMDPDLAVRYRQDGGAWTVYEGPMTIEGDGTHLLEYEAEDDAGNIGHGSLTIRIDTIAPTSQISVQGTVGNESRYVSEVLIDLTAFDAGSGISHIYYRVNGGTWYAYSSAFQLTEDGTYLLERYAVDMAGNEGAVVGLTIALDATAPAIQVQVTGASDNGWYRAPVNVAISSMDAMDGECAVTYKVDGGTWTTYVGEVTVEGDGDHTLEYRSTDLAGNTVYGSVEMAIDTLAPQSAHTLSGELGEGGRYVGPVTASLTATDQGSGVEAIYYRMDDDSFTLYLSALLLDVDGTHLLEHYAVDLAGNVGPISQIQVMIDTQGPWVEIATDRAPSTYGWYDGTVTITLTSMDHFDQGCPVHYRWDEGDWTSYSSPFAISEEGEHLLEFYAVDLAGNMGELFSQTFRLDLTDPLCSLVASGDMGSNGHYVSEVIVTVSCEDQGSGVDTTHYRCNGGAWADWEGQFTISADGLTHLEVYSVDRAGNVGDTSHLNISIDTVPPVVMADVDAQEMNGWYASAVNVTLFSEEVSDIHYRLDDGNWTEYLVPVHIETEGTHHLEWYGTDLAGNVGPTGELDLRLDLTGPRCYVAMDGEVGDNGYFVSQVTIVVNVSEEGSGTSALWCRVDGGDWRICDGTQLLDTDGVHLIELYAVDNAGNVGAVLSEEVAIDTSPPVVSMEVLKEPQPDGSYLNHAFIGFHATDGCSGVALNIYNLDGGGWEEVQGDVLVQGEGIHTIVLYAVDAAGHNSSAQLSLDIVLPLEAPSELGSLNATVLEEGILLTWVPSVTQLEASYLIYRSAEEKEVLIAEVLGTSYLDENVSEGVEYDYRVVPVNVIGEGPSSEVLGLALPEDASQLSLILIMALVGLGIASLAIVIRRR